MLCACGCGKKVAPKPAYFSAACRNRAKVRRWREAHPEQAKAQNRKDAAAFRARKKA